MMNKMQIKAIEERLTTLLQRIERIEDKETLSDKDQARLVEYREQLHGADMILTLAGYVRDYHMGTEDERGRLRGSYYTLAKI